ncbi:hypothetical protein ATANTOWER_013383 [Ataeniobius toweri]|uniref:Uncharacterized protein n=1 Tax=Ataeniobius toweri TaxID=208326 RepID=A0ABU7A8Y6_9TELE|nr:hypothetical protein [Ataeniobius toweri]
MEKPGAYFFFTSRFNTASLLHKVPVGLRSGLFAVLVIERTFEPKDSVFRKDASLSCAGSSPHFEHSWRCPDLCLCCHLRNMAAVSLRPSTKQHGSMHVLLPRNLSFT